MGNVSKRVRKSIVLAMLLCFLTAGMLVIIASLPSVNADGNPFVMTDKADYSPEETVTIFGSGFTPNSGFDVVVIRPGGSVVTGDGTFTPGYDTITSDANGNIFYYYILDGILGTYEVKVFSSPSDWRSGQTPIASTTFTDCYGTLHVFKYEDVNP
jgi:hypothetical protein